MKRLLEGYAKDAAARKRSTENDLANNLSNVKRYPGYDGVMKADPRGAPSSSSLSPSASTLQMMDAHEGPPHFLVIGAQKAGTMAVVKNLNKHPEICCLSEEHYFDLGYRSKSLNSYRSLFQKAPGSAPEKRILGDKTPEYGYVEDCHSRIKAACGQETKFIMMIRDPVKRAYSAWNMNIKRNFEVNLFDECVEKNFKNLNEHRSYGTAEYHYVQRGFYLDQILRFLETFPNRDNLLIIVAEHIRKDPMTHYTRIFDFLGARSNISLDYEDDHVGEYTSPMSASIAEKLRKMYKPHNDRLFKFLGYSIPEWGQVSVGKHNTSKVEMNPVPVPSIAAVVGPTAVETALSPSEIPVPPLQAEERAIES